MDHWVYQVVIYSDGHWQRRGVVADRFVDLQKSIWQSLGIRFYIAPLCQMKLR